jgi:protease I
MARVLIPLPSNDFDPTEAAVPWKMLKEAGHEVLIATPQGRVAHADPIMVTGEGLGWLAGLLRADPNGRAAHEELIASREFGAPLAYGQLTTASADALVLPGGHAPGMKEYLESVTLQKLIGEFFKQQRPVGAICHGVLLAARSPLPGSEGRRSVLWGRKTTALTSVLELSGWWLTRAWMGDYYRTYERTVQAEVTAALASPDDFIVGPPALLRDSIANPGRGFVVRDENYVSARWPGDAHRFAIEFLKLLG